MSNDPWYFQRWAREQKLGNATRKLILMSLATTAESSTGWCFALQDDLAGHAECSVRTVSGHLKAMESTGLITRRKRFSRHGRRLADGFLLLAPGVIEWPDGEPIDDLQNRPPEESSSGDPPHSPPEVQASEQERPKGTTKEKERDAQAREREPEKPDPRLLPPDGFPDELRPHARHVMAVLRQVAVQHGANEVYPLAVGRVMMAYPRRPLVETAHALATWAVDPPRAVKDVVSTYRTFLKRERDLAATERLAQDGTPAAGRAPDTDGVTPLFGGGGRRMSNAEQVDANIRALRSGGQGGDIVHG